NQNRIVQREYSGPKIEQSPRENIIQETKSDDFDRFESEKKTNFTQPNTFKNLENDMNQEESDRSENDNKQVDENNRFSGLISRIKKEQDEDESEY
ncbi:MAG: hypothetical protein VW886_05835, partial [Candidatus Heimdallarchaeota archaeon]